MADSNPANFANRPTEEVRAIASKGGKAAHEKAVERETGRRTDGTFVPGSDAAKEAGRKGGVIAQEHAHEQAHDSGRREDGTFKPGSEAAKEAGRKGGIIAQEHAHEAEDNGRREDGTFKPGSEAAKEAGHKGGLAH
ncbi:hypothetical protein EJ05DRAFT_476367 [Pseudovirgaria hyperparasitica]|uniref:Conidiation-specific protein 10 n=1 Tax=Pseudovirgaria hyperparasitica TaxID=470096 RepID=A0A6A6W941_9PEZI|nr:uncharacterized protein EJ05DRAFT_476367 [Pseudovirgaria hyperparasitica]KAF2758107.1 hypothetical protein EJ05DRAFT_476367 [Pseudovirgaria hyperparasitica]